MINGRKTTILNISIHIGKITYILTAKTKLIIPTFKVRVHAFLGETSLIENHIILQHML